MTGDQAERTVIALERIGTGLLRLAAAAERLAEQPRRDPPADVAWVAPSQRRRFRRPWET